MTTIKEILGNKYSDFLEYCIKSEKIYPSDISSSDYVAFRVQYGVGRDYIQEIKNRIINCEVCDTDAVPFDVPEKNDVVKEDHKLTEEKALNSIVLNETCNSEINNISESDIVNQEITVEHGYAECDTKEDNFSGFPYDLNTPLDEVLGVDDLEPYSRIRIEAMELKPRVERILKEKRREFVSDILRCSIAQLFDFNRVTKTAIVSIIEQIKMFVSYDVSSIKIKLTQTTIPFDELFDVIDIEQYKTVSVESIAFSTRFANALKANKIETVYLLLQLNIDSLQKWDNLGNTSIKDAVTKLDEYLKSTDKSVVKISSSTIQERKIKEKIISLIHAEIQGKEISLNDLTEQENVFYTQVKEAISDCGEELFVTINSKPSYSEVISKALRMFYIPVLDNLSKKNKIFQAYSEMPAEFKNKSAKFLHKVYILRNHQEVAFLGELDAKITMSKLIEKVKHDDVSDSYKSLERFLQWIKNINIECIIDEIFKKDVFTGINKIDEDLKDKYWLVLEMRSEGETLEDIGLLINATRERVRQIEKKLLRHFTINYQNNEYDLLAIIHMLRGEDNVLNKNEVQEIIGERNANLLWLVLSKGLLDCNVYRYSKGYDAVLFIEDGKNDATSCEHIIEELPHDFFEDELDDLLGDLSEKHNISKELIIVDIGRQYSKYGKLYSQSSPSVIFMCDYILKTKFPSGFKTGDPDEAKRFQTYLIETFGDKKGLMTARALDSKIGAIGVLCDRGKYLHPCYVHIDKLIIDEINSYIESNEKTVITYSEIFDEMQSTLNGSQITNRFMLQGALKYYGCQFKLTRDYVTKNQEKNLTDEFESFAREHGEFHKMDFFTAFPAMTDANLGMLVGRCKNVFSIDNGYYLHSSVLDIVKDDYESIRTYLDHICADGPVNSRFLFEEFSYKFIDFLSRNEISNHTKLFGVLGYMFGEEFVFSRPYVSKEEHASLTNKDVVLKYLEDYDTITIEDVIEMCQERGIRYVSSGYLIRQISPAFIRINETTLMRYELTGITDDVILEVATYVANQVETDTYCSVAAIKDFLWFSTIDVEWTSHLVESVMYLAGDLVGRISIPTSNFMNLTSIYVSEEYLEDDYVTFVLKILDSAFKKGFFNSKTEIREFLADKGLISNNTLPNFLEGADYYYMSEDGTLKRRQ